MVFEMLSLANYSQNTSLWMTFDRSDEHRKDS